MEENLSIESSISSIAEYVNTLHEASEMEVSAVNSVNVDWEEPYDKKTKLSVGSEHFDESRLQEINKTKFRKMYLVAFAALMNAVCMGYSATYSSTATHDMQTRLASAIKPTEDQIGWIGSLLPVGALFGGMIAGQLTESVGRKGALLFSCIPFVLGWLMIAFANTVGYIYGGRLIVGLCCGIVSVTTPMYLVEISTPEVRGLLGASFQLFVTIGIFIVSCFGAELNWSWLAIVGAAFSVMTLLGLIFIPESPRWLMSKGRKDETLWTIHVLQGNFLDVPKECELISDDIANQPKGGLKLKELLTPIVYKPALLSFALMIFQQGSGVNAVLFYTVNIFTNAGSSLDATSATIVVSVVQVFATLVSSVLMDKAGRKILLLVSGSFMALSLIIFGIYDYIAVQNKSFQIEYGWLPVVCIVIYISAFSLGFGPIPWLMVSEMTSARFRSATNGAATALNWTLAFIITKAFHGMEIEMHGYGTYWTYAAICTLSCVFTYFLLPETKGKRIEEILTYFTSRTDDSTIMTSVEIDAKK